MNPQAKSSMPILSVVIAVFNAEKTIARAIQSVHAQDYPHKELIIIDGGSNDGTVDIIRSLSAQVTQWESEKDRGIYHAFNKGVSRATGDWILFLGADDYLWAPNVFSDAASKLSKLKNCAIAYGRVSVVNAEGAVLETVGKPWPAVKKIIQHEMAIPHQGTFHHKDLYARHGLYREDFKIAGDYELLLRELKNSEPHFLGGMIISGMQIGGISSLPSSTLRAIEEFKTARRLNGIDSISFWLLRRELRARLRKLLFATFGRRVSDYAADAYRVAVGKKRIWTRK